MICRRTAFNLTECRCCCSFNASVCHSVTYPSTQRLHLFPSTYTPFAPFFLAPHLRNSEHFQLVASPVSRRRSVHLTGAKHLHPVPPRITKYVPAHIRRLSNGTAHYRFSAPEAARRAAGCYLRFRCRGSNKTCAAHQDRAGQDDPAQTSASLCFHYFWAEQHLLAPKMLVLCGTRTPYRSDHDTEVQR